MKFTGITIVGAAVVAAAQPHNHLHRHPARHGSPVEARDAATTTTVPGPTVTIYKLADKIIPDDEVAAGIAAGIYVLVGDKISTVIPASTSSTSTSTSTSTTPTPVPTTSSTEAAQFIQVSTSTTSSTSVAPAAATTSAAAVQAEAVSTAASSTASTAAGTGINAEFPSGKIKCDAFPSSYGAVYIDWLGLGGYTGLQSVPNYSPGDASISYIETPLAGSTCGANMFCSYACPEGYQKSQWPSAQGSTGQSIGGLYCNANGYLELSRTSVSTLCIAGVGNVQIKNTLSKNVAVCRTDYPGLESETIPLNTQPGQTYELCNPDASTYYTWEGSPTSAQYYVNPSGVDVSEACTWGSSANNWGNWAPLNIGVGKSIAGETFISLIPNSPTNPDGVLDFSVKITGDVSGECSYSNGVYYQGTVANTVGCTVSVSGTAVFEFY